ncbi:MAG: hypothetical protein CL609_09875 [Anaerolineaceae bacterium]|nr:hypothetical protein [Anaerolineaceae bacterium]
MKNEAQKKVEVLVTVPLNENLIESLKNVSPKLNITVQTAKNLQDIPNEVLKKTEVLFTDQFIPDSAITPNLRWIQFNYAGLDFLLDHPITQNSDIKLTSLSGAAAPQVAEYILTMMLSLGHKIPAIMRHQRNREWLPDRYTRLVPTELRGKTLGVVGYGSIGREIARLVQPFGVKVMASKRDVMHPEESGYTPEGLGDPEGNLFTRLYPIQAIKSMFKLCDFVVISLPKTKETIGLISEAEFGAMKPEAFFIDVSRGGITNSEALRTALLEKEIAGAALDVFPEEPLPKDSPLWETPNLIISPHISGISSKYNERSVSLFIKNLNLYLEDCPLLNIFNPVTGY